MEPTDLALLTEPVLGIETSCDETSAAVLLGSTPASNVVSSQVEMHEQWGGIVPEAAARAHVEAILPVVEEALQRAGIGLDAVRAVAVTNRPGLVGALSVGVTAAKALAFAWNLPMVGVHHLEGHILSTFLEGCSGGPPGFPHLCLVVSGGHTETVLVERQGAYRIVGQTLDDAAGEAFDKAARLLGLGYPGGRAIQESAINGDPNRYPLPRALPKDPCNFSFSGLKTAVLRLVEREGDRLDLPDAAASIQEAIIEALATKAVAAAEEADGVQALSLVGGVAANRRLRERLRVECSRAGLAFHTPPAEFCTDNAAMIALAGSWRLHAGQRSGFDLDVFPNAPLDAKRA